MAPAQKDMDLWKGSDATWTIRLWADAGKTTRFDLTGSEIVFRATWGGGSLRRTSADGGIDLGDPTDGEITITIPAAAGRALPAGRVVRYEIERRIAGTETTLIYGNVVVSDWGANDDA